MSTPELILIQQELSESLESHAAIANKLRVTQRVVAMVCNDMMKGKKCKHGTVKSTNETMRTRTDDPNRLRWRTVGLTISDADWNAFRNKHSNASKRLGELIRVDIQSRTLKP